MTTSPVISVTDELIAELEDLVGCDTPDHVKIHGITFGEARALIAERAELKRDAERLEWFIKECCVMECMNGTMSPIVYRLCWPRDGEQQIEWYASKRAAIDAAMQSEANP